MILLFLLLWEISLDEQFQIVIDYYGIILLSVIIVARTHFY